MNALDEQALREAKAAGIWAPSGHLSGVRVHGVYSGLVGPSRCWSAWSTRRSGLISVTATDVILLARLVSLHWMTHGSPWADVVLLARGAPCGVTGCEPSLVDRPLTDREFAERCPQCLGSGFMWGPPTDARDLLAEQLVGLDDAQTVLGDWMLESGLDLRAYPHGLGHLSSLLRAVVETHGNLETAVMLAAWLEERRQDLGATSRATR